MHRKLLDTFAFMFESVVLEKMMGNLSGIQLG